MSKYSQQRYKKNKEKKQQIKQQMKNSDKEPSTFILILIALFWLFIITIVATSCNGPKQCTKHFNKALRGGCITADTFTRYDTIVGLKTDTIFKGINVNLIDTFIIDTGGIRVRTITNWRDRIINQKITQRDTILKYQNVTINAPKHVQKWHERWQNIAFICGVICFILLISFTQNPHRQ
jgi:hypothetical protein